ncbi:hypothetical protein DFQ01_10653 [Paenibacillus cellulosilyticus]|uniref:Uncharacterized protein n=1 Tax=Paenibacillus cellulosilyticus TaxID=375489 RepID=A0A2V2YUJ2_9BACL|nr:hypothetical protein DFQ01_10653 [Paenibacillus cellulosilyticus]QKS45893.1 hypothetical protein HUB94_16665 [Paenibacillus cellulosilyticus]
MLSNWLLALIIFLVINGIIAWQMITETEPMSRRARKWFFIVGNIIALILAVAEFIWMDF